MAAHDSRLEELDAEGILAFAEQLLLNVARMWADASSDQKQRLQRVLFPAGVTYGAEGFGTTEASLVFEVLDALAAPESSEASPTGVEPVGLSLRERKTQADDDWRRPPDVARTVPE